MYYEKMYFWLITPDVWKASVQAQTNTVDVKAHGDDHVIGNLPGLNKTLALSSPARTKIAYKQVCTLQFENLLFGFHKFPHATISVQLSFKLCNVYSRKIKILIYKTLI